MSAHQFHREIEKAVSQWLENRQPQPRDRGHMPPIAFDGFRRQIDQAVDEWRKERQHEQGNAPPLAPPCPAPSPVPVSAPTLQPLSQTWLNRWKTLVAWGVLIYLGMTAAAWALMRFFEENSALASALLYGPRWFALTPLPCLVVLLIWRKSSRWLFIPLALAGLIAWMPIGGWQWPWRVWMTTPSQQPVVRLRILSCDKGAGVIDFAAFQRLALDHQADLIAIQNIRADRRLFEERFPDWYVESLGDLVLISRHPISNPQLANPGGERSKNAVLGCMVETSVGKIRVVNLSFRRLLSRRDGASKQTAELLKNDGVPTLILGSFNMPIESSIYRRDWRHFRNAFDEAGLGYGHTWSNSWGKVRLDHVLGSQGWRFAACSVGPDLGCDHRPLLVDARLYLQ